MPPNRLGRLERGRRTSGPAATIRATDRDHCAFGAPVASAALGSGTGLSDRVLRYERMSARSDPREMPAKVMLVPGPCPRGLLMKWVRSSIVQLPPLAFSAAE